MDRPVDSRGVAASGTGRFRFELATPTDDEELRRLLRETAMDGPVRVTLRREPSYFGGALQGPVHQVVIARDTQSGRIVCMGERSVRLHYVDGQETPVGYLGGLRMLPEYRGGTILARGYRLFRDLHQDGAAAYYLTTIAQGNRAAAAALVGGRAGLPIYYRLCDYSTFVLPLRPRRRRVPADIDVRPLRAEELPVLLKFLRDAGRKRLFFPCYTAADFTEPHGTFHGLPAEGIFTAWRSGRLIGTLAAWDQSALRQTVVEGYSPLLRCLSPAYNLWARLRGWPLFPPPGERLRHLTAALPLVAGDAADAPTIFGSLLAAAGEYGRRLGLDCLLIGASEHDPLWPSLKQAALFSYVTHVYLVFWEEDAVRPAQFAGRDLYLELGCL